MPTDLVKSWTALTSGKLKTSTSLCARFGDVVVLVVVVGVAGVCVEIVVTEEVIGEKFQAEDFYLTLCKVW